MLNQSLFDMIPLWAFFLLSGLITFLAIEAGLRLGYRRRRQADHEKEGPVGSVVAASLGLLAFIMAFTFGYSATRFDTRNQLLLDDVNAISTAYLRAGLLQEPHSGQVRGLLREYVGIRANLRDLVRTPAAFRASVERSEAIQEELWMHAGAITEVDRHSDIDALFIASLNGMFDTHTLRLVALQRRLPLSIWTVLAVVAILAMAVVGFQFGLAGKRSVYATVALALVFSAVLLLIRDLDQPMSGWLKVNQQPMIDLQHKLADGGGS